MSHIDKITRETGNPTEFRHKELHKEFAENVEKRPKTVETAENVKIHKDIITMEIRQ